jgi:ATP-dependent protease ClpP protease subunit
MNKPDNDTFKLNDNGIYLLMEDIEQESCAKVIEWILQENLKKDKDRRDHLKLMISSPGGNANACFAFTTIFNW